MTSTNPGLSGSGKSSLGDGSGEGVGLGDWLGVALDDTVDSGDGVGSGACRRARASGAPPATSNVATANVRSRGTLLTDDPLDDGHDYGCEERQGQADDSRLRSALGLLHARDVSACGDVAHPGVGERDDGQRDEDGYECVSKAVQDRDDPVHS